MAVRHLLLDTNAYAALKLGTPEAIEIIRYVPSIGISSVVLGELLGGFAVGTQEAANRQELERFFVSGRVQVLVVDAETAQYYAMVYRDLRRKGHPIPTNDMWIAATALQHDLALYSYDNHFQTIDGLITGNQLSDFTL